MDDFTVKYCSENTGTSTRTQSVAQGLVSRFLPPLSRAIPPCGISRSGGSCNHSHVSLLPQGISVALSSKNSSTLALVATHKPTISTTYFSTAGGIDTDTSIAREGQVWIIQNSVFWNAMLYYPNSWVKCLRSYPVYPIFG